jgi:hypothetical protein
MSNINPNNINGSYPVAGIDNDSQGFRDNFTNIKNNMAFAASEITDLQNKVILKSPLANTTLNNNLTGALLSGATVRDFRETSYDSGVVTTTATLDHFTGHYQRVTTGASVQIAFSNPPAAGSIGRYRLKLTVASTSHRLILPSTVTVGVRYLENYNKLTRSIGFSQIGAYYFEFLTDDGGISYHIADMTRNSSAVDYNYYMLANDFTISTTVGKNIIDGLTPLTVGNINLPLNPSDGQVVSISTATDVAALYLYANVTASTTIGGNVTSLTAYDTVSYTYVGAPSNSSVNAWFKTN